MLLAILVIWSSVLFFCLYQKNKKYYQMGDAIPGPPSIPLFGNAHLLIGKPEQMMKKVYKFNKEYKRLVRIWLGSYLNVLVYDPRDAEIILKSKDTVKARQYEYLKDWLGESILISSGEKFKLHKKFIIQSLHMNNLKKFIPIFHQHSKKMVQELDNYVGKGEFDIGEIISNCSLNVLLDTSVGVNKDTLGQEKLEKYSHAVEALTRSALMRIINPHLAIDFLFKLSNQKKIQDESLQVVNPIMTKIIEHRRKEISCNNNNNSYNDNNKTENLETGEEFIKKGSLFVDRFLLAKKDDGSSFTEKEIKDEVSTIMFGGHDTTTVSVGFVLSLLGCYLDCQEKVLAELDDIFGNSKRPPTYEDLTQMEYLERVIMEAWRLYPPIPLVGKKATKDIPLENCIIPAGTSIGVTIMLLHRNPDYYSDPDGFNPDHFLPENVKERHPCAFIPFSVGTRTCVGKRYAMLSMKVIISNVLRNFRVHSKTRHREFKVVAQTVLRRKGGFPVSITPRNHPISARG